MQKELIMTNEDWKKAYKEGFSDGYAAAKKEMSKNAVPTASSA